MTAQDRELVTKSAVLFLIDKLSGLLGKTQLVKLLFLADLEHFRQTGEQVTNLEYEFYHYGPYDSKVEDYLKDLVARDFVKEEKNERRDQNGYFFRYSPLIHAESYKYLSNVQCAILDEVADNFGKMTLNSLLELVYSMLSKHKLSKGEKINFAEWEELQTIRRETSEEVLNAQ